MLTSPEDLAPWYRAGDDGVLVTPEWEFRYSDLRRFRPTEAVRESAAEAYDQYQKCGLAAARRLFWGAP